MRRAKRAGQLAGEAVPEAGLLAHKLHRLIEASGPISVAAFMAEANAHYYATRDPFGAGGDFITAPEISQMFGELIGLWCADLWMRAGKPADLHYVELGPGRGTLAKDALRAMAQVGLDPPVHFVETSPVLREAQTAAVPYAIFHDDTTTLPESGPLLIVANEFFDALPVRQLVATHSGWRERVVARDAGRFIALPGVTPMDAAVPDALRHQTPGTILESSPAAHAVMLDLAQRLAAQGGVVLTIDYGYEGPAVGDTLQAVQHHNKTAPFDNVGEQDLTAHVDFAALAHAARNGGVRVVGPVGQGAWLRSLGLDVRTATLAESAPEQADTIRGQAARLADADQMGNLFKVMAAYAPGWPVPEGFAA